MIFCRVFGKSLERKENLFDFEVRYSLFAVRCSSFDVRFSGTTIIHAINHSLEKAQHTAPEVDSISPAFEFSKESFENPKPLLIQPKLSVGAVDDPFEHEADAMADRVMRMPDTSFIQRKCASCEEEEQISRKPENTFLQRKCAACEHEEEEQIQRKITPFIQKKGNGLEGGTASESVTNQINASRGGGSRMSENTLSFMESRFNTDFSGVKIHTDSNAIQMSHELNAQAFTVGNDIYFNSGKYSPESASGKHLLAHELTHTVQQGGAVQRKEEDEIDILQTKSNFIQRQEEETPMTRGEEIELSNSSDGEVSIQANPMVFTLSNFAINSPLLKARHRDVLREIGHFMHAVPSDRFDIHIEGNTDDTGSDAVNNPLSVRRAVSVRNLLRQLRVGNLQVEGEGELNPVTGNESVSGRSRNRRVEVSFVPRISTPTPQPTQTPTPIPDPIPTPTPDPIPTPIPDPTPTPIPDPTPTPVVPTLPPHVSEPFCEAHPIICGIIGLGGLGVILCILFPEVCLAPFIPFPRIPPVPPIPGLPEPTPDPERQPDEPEQPQPHACVDTVNLPSGSLRFDNSTGRYLHVPFTMSIDFIDDPTTGCVCECGEYRQYVRGYFERKSSYSAPWRRQNHSMRGILMNEYVFLEDGTYALGSGYGHRDNLPQDNDTFTGCEYRGTDAPGLNIVPQSEGARMHLEFIGVPFDACNQRPMVEHIHHWTVDGELLPNPPPVVSAPHVTDPDATTAPTFVIPRPIQQRAATPYSSSYGGGIPATAHVGERYMLRIVYRSRTGEPLWVAGPVDIVAEDTNTVTLETINPVPLNVAPVGEEPIILNPHQRITLNRSILDR